MKVLVMNEEDKILYEGFNLLKLKSELSKKVKGLKIAKFMSLIYQLYLQAKNGDKFDLKKAVQNAKKEGDIKDSYVLMEGIGKDIAITSIILKVLDFLYNCLMTGSVSQGLEMTNAEAMAEYTAMSATSVSALISDVLPFIGITVGGMFILATVLKVFISKN